MTARAIFLGTNEITFPSRKRNTAVEATAYFLPKGDKLVHR